RQIADFHDIVAALLIENGNDIEYLVASVGLSDRISLIGGAYQLEDIDGAEPPSFKVILAQTNGQLRQPGWGCKLHIRRARHIAQHAGDLLRLLRCAALSLGEVIWWRRPRLGWKPHRPR